MEDDIGESGSEPSIYGKIYTNQSRYVKSNKNIIRLRKTALLNGIFLQNKFQINKLKVCYIKINSSICQIAINISKLKQIMISEHIKNSVYYVFHLHRYFCHLIF